MDREAVTEAGSGVWVGSGSRWRLRSAARARDQLGSAEVWGPQGLGAESGGGVERAGSRSGDSGPGPDSG